MESKLDTMDESIELEKYNVEISEIERGVVDDPKFLNDAELGTVKRGLKARHIQFIAVRA